MDIIQSLEQYRLEHRISQQELAAKIGTSFSTINRWLNGKTRPGKIHNYHVQKLLSQSGQGSKD